VRRATVHSSRCERAEIGEDATVGPFAHLRPGTVLDARAKVGAFAETKNSRIGAGSKVPHLAYVGDATVGADVNVACGVITVNYDGRDKHRTTIEDGAFVGCDTMLVAPVTIGAGAYTAAGSTITEDVPARRAGDRPRTAGRQGRAGWRATGVAPGAGVRRRWSGGYGHGPRRSRRLDVAWKSSPRSG
jgi:bifunctional UDP-N-acetylglucosamine pyrophosphorylase / glucosamine-1-phosphate N-acetyltransferase